MKRIDPPSHVVFDVGTGTLYCSDRRGYWSGDVQQRAVNLCRAINSNLKVPTCKVYALTEVDL